MPKAYRHVRAAKQAAAGRPLAKKDYVIIDPAHKPDLRGEFAGAKVTYVGGQQMVRLSDAQAKFYLDQGTIRPLNPTPAVASK